MFNEFGTGQIELFCTIILGLHKHRPNANALGSNSDTAQGVGQDICAKAMPSKVADDGQPAND